MYKIFGRHPGEADAIEQRSIATAYAGLALALAFILGMAIWGVYHDLQLVRTTLLQSEMGRLRSHAMRTVGIIQDEMHLRQNEGQAELLTEFEFLRKHWQQVLRDPSRRYSAIVDLSGKIVMHFEPSHEGQNIGLAWYDFQVSEAGDDVVQTRSLELTGGDHCYDVSVPIFMNDRLAGMYHSGLSGAWLERTVAERQASSKRAWAFLLSAIGLVVVVSGGSLFVLSRRLTMLRESIKLTRSRRFAELGQLMAGIVHEIRNPLNAMRLNLHVLSRSQSRTEEGREGGLRFDGAQIIQETNFEIERVEGLLRILLGYARPDNPRNELLDVGLEVQSTLKFLQPLLERDDLLLKAVLGDQPLKVYFDRDRFRQILLNLINNAREATEAGGRIELIASQGEGRIQIIVADDGPGVPIQDRERIFEPFYTTKDLGTGLGLAIVKRFIEESGGKVTCQPNEPREAMFVIHLPAASASLTSSQPFYSHLS